MVVSVRSLPEGQPFGRHFVYCSQHVSTVQGDVLHPRPTMAIQVLLHVVVDCNRGGMLHQNKLETDIFAKDIPIYVSTKSCHPPQVFKSVAKSVGLRLRMNCSLDRFLTPRIEEYTRYLVASNYDRR